ncbi:hypothetical protein STANM309S_02876 [Streptomyces tanashiensis]
MPFALIAAVTVVDVLSPPDVHLGPFLIAAPAVTASFAGPRMTAFVGAIAVLAQSVVAVARTSITDLNHTYQIVALVLISVIATFFAHLRERDEKRVTRLRFIAQAAQSVVLRPLPTGRGRCTSPPSTWRPRRRPRWAATCTRAGPHRDGDPVRRRRQGLGPDAGGAARPDPDSRCVGNASCIPHCPSYAKYTPLKTQGRWSTSVTLRDRSVVSRVLVDGRGRATGVEYLSYEGEAAVAHADVVVLAAHAVENARLLLLSGLAGRSGQVGRNLMDHPVLLTWGLLPDAEHAGSYRGPGSVSGFEGFRSGPARRLRAPFRVEFGTWGWIWAKGPVDTDVEHFLTERGLFGEELRTAVRDRVRRQFTLQFEMEQAADPANRVTLHPTERDALGLPRPLVTYDLDEHVKEGMAAARAVSDQIFALLGAEDHTDYTPSAAWPGRFEHRGRTYGYRGAGHAAGTHVMGDSPATSVVDAWQRCWDHPGLYAVGCGSMPSVATSNPTLTMAALALRSAERIEADLMARDHPLSLAPTAPGASA